jgi:ornithine cyclodeaminase/alanine dehydrogenase-like protein (mu-crystallin family)
VEQKSAAKRFPEPEAWRLSSREADMNAGAANLPRGTIPCYSDADVKALALTPKELREAIEAAYMLRQTAAARLIPKVGLVRDDLGFCHAMPAMLGDLSVVKWVVCGAGRSLHATLLASDGITGETLAVIDASWLTGVRTAAVSAVAAARLASPTSSTLGIVGCGLQARTHFEAFRDLFPLTRVLCSSRRVTTAETFAEEVRSAGVAAEVFDDPRAVVAGADIIVTGIPIASATEPFLDAADLRPHAFVAAVDHAKSWKPGGFSHFDLTVTDDREHTDGMLAQGLLKFDHAIDLDLPALLRQDAQGRRPARTLMLAPGNALSDAAVVRLVLDRFPEHQNRSNGFPMESRRVP